MVFGIDDLLVMAAIAAISYGANEMASSDAERKSKKQARTLRDQQLEQARLDYYHQQAAEAARLMGPGAPNEAETFDGWRQRKGIDMGYEGAMRAASDQSALQRTQNGLQLGTSLAGGLARFGAANMGSEAAIGHPLNSDELAKRAQTYNLDPNNSQLLAGPGGYTPMHPLRSSDPSGGFQLQPEDYLLLSGNAPGRYRYTL